MKFHKFFLLLWVIFALLDPDSDSEYGSGSTDPIESGSNWDADPQPCFEGLASLFPVVGQEGEEGSLIWQTPCLNIAGEERIIEGEYLGVAGAPDRFPLAEKGERVELLRVDG
jgi:hypothetical protein